MPGGIDARLVAPDGTPLLTGKTPWGSVLLSVEPIRLLGFFKAVTNSGVQTQTIVPCPSGTALYVADVVISASKQANALVTVRFYDAATNAENIVIIDVNDKGNQLSIHPAGRTLGWEGAYIQLLTDTIGQAATCTVWFSRITGDLVLPYAKWIAMRGL